MNNYIALLIGVIIICKKALEFEKISRFEQVIIPTYSLIMFLFTMTWTKINILILIVLLVISYFIAKYQISDVEIKSKGDYDKYGRPIVLVKKNGKFIVGWIVNLVIGLALGILLSEHSSLSHLLEELGGELKKEIFLLATFSHKAEWYIWLITGATSVIFTYFLKVKNDKVKLALRKRKN